MKPIIALTIGDFNGVGPEIVLKTAVHPSVQKNCTLLLVGPLRVFEHIAKLNKIKLKFERATLPSLQHSSPFTIPIVDVGDGISADIQYGTPTKASGRSAGIALERAVELCLQNKTSAMVTAPVSKEALNSAGYNFPGQTEMIALLTRSQRVAMMLISDTMRVGLVTIHTGLKNVAGQISKEKVVEKIFIIDDSLKKDFRVEKTKTRYPCAKSALRREWTDWNRRAGNYYSCNSGVLCGRNSCRRPIFRGCVLWQPYVQEFPSSCSNVPRSRINSIKDEFLWQRCKLFSRT